MSHASRAGTLVFFACSSCGSVHMQMQDEHGNSVLEITLDDPDQTLSDLVGVINESRKRQSEIGTLN